MDYNFKLFCSFFCVVNLLLLVRSDGFKERPCFSKELEQCWSGETCEVIVADAGIAGRPDGHCKCLRNYGRDEEGKCIPVKKIPGLPTPGRHYLDSESSSVSVTAGVLIPLFLIAGLAALFIFGRRRGWHQRLWRPRVRQYDTALVGNDLDDDPPIA